MNGNSSSSDGAPLARHRSFPLYARVLAGVALGIVFGIVFGTRPYLFGMVRNDDLGLIATLVVRLLKALATPLILFAILDSFVRTQITARQGGRLLLICLVNVSVAMCIGLTIMNVVRPGVHWRGEFEGMAAEVRSAGSAEEVLAKSRKGSISFVKNLEGYVPESLVQPLLENNVIPVVLLGLLGGAALRRVREKQREEGEDSIHTVEQFVAAVYRILMTMLGWVVLTVPFALFGAVAKTVGQYGVGVFGVLWLFLFVMLAGLAIHSFLYYPMVAWLVGRKPPAVYLGQGSEGMLTAISTNSSLATVPVTLRCLERMRVSLASSRLAACVGTNLNNDGITLYEAMAALFLAQAVGFELGLGQQITVVLASIMAGAGVAGIPEAGLIVLPLVLGAAGLPDSAIVMWLPLIMTVDWIIARARSVVNVMSDMLVAILLDRSRRPEEDSTMESDEACTIPQE